MAEVVERVETCGWVVAMVKPLRPILGFAYEVVLTRPDGASLVMSRDDDFLASMEDMNAAAFAIAAVLDPEHNGPWQEGPGPVGAQQSDDDKEQNL